MIIPIRCFSCAKPIGHLWEEFEKKVENGQSKKEAMDELGVVRFCCRAHLMGHVDLADLAAQFKKN